MFWIAPCLPEFPRNRKSEAKFGDCSLKSTSKVVRAAGAIAFLWHEEMAFHLKIASAIRMALHYLGGSPGV